MSSREIAELTGKGRPHVLREIRVMLDDLGDEPVLDHVREEKDARDYTPCIHRPKDLTMTLVAGYSTPLRFKIIRRWQTPGMCLRLGISWWGWAHADTMPRGV